MRAEPRQRVFESVSIFAADPQRRLLLLIDRASAAWLVDWASGEAGELPRLEIPRHHHMATQGARALAGGPSLLDLVLQQAQAVVLTSEGVWTCPLDGADGWTRVAGHPTDLPAGLSYHAAKRDHPVVELAHDNQSVRLGSSPVALSADGSTVVGAPHTRDVAGLSHYKYPLKVQTLGAAPRELAPQFRSSIEALAIDGDGSTIAFSEGRDFRVLRSGAKRAQQMKHERMYVRQLHLSADGRFAAATGLYPNDVRAGPQRIVVWDVEARRVLDVLLGGWTLGFIGRGDRCRLAVRQGRFDSPRISTQLYAPGDPAPRHVVEGWAAERVDGDAGFFVSQANRGELRIEASEP